MSIRQHRAEIDRIDRALVRLLNRRARHSLAIGRMKDRAGLPLFHRRREQQIAQNVRQANRGPLPDKNIQHMFEEILRATRAAVRRALRAERRAAKKPRGRKH